MKKLRCFLLLLLSVTVLIAQDAETPYVSFGASLEAGYSGVNGDVTDDYFGTFGTMDHLTTERRRPGYSFGVWLSYWLSPHWDVELGANFGAWSAFAEQKTDYYGPTGVHDSYSRERFTLRQHLLRIPLQARFYLGRSDRSVRPYITLGVQAAYVTSQTGFEHNLYHLARQDPSQFFYSLKFDLGAAGEDIRRWQSSIIGGIGLQMDRVRVSIQRNWPFTNIPPDEQGSHRAFPDLYPGDRLDGSFLNCDSLLCQLRQTSLRFSYHIF
ncbi:MAG: porin family protein [Bacteroidota bacterium]